MFWKKTASFILKNRLFVLISVVVLSVFMSYEASKVKITFNGGKVLPVTDSAYIRYNQFKKMFGQDASSMVIGIKSDKIFDKDIFNDWYQIGNNLRQVKGVKAVISVANVYNLQKDTTQHRFIIKPLVTGALPTAQAVDSIKQQLANLPFYKGVVLSNDGKSTLMAITFDDKIINTPYRVPIINKIKKLGAAFEQKHGIKVHYSGLPLIRTVVGDLVAHEFSMFLSLSVL